MGGTSVYRKKVDSSKKEEAAPAQVRNISGFQPERDKFEALCKVEAKLDVCLKFLSQAHNEFYALKSVDVSIDGKLGGKGYVLEIPEIRNRLHAAVDNISGLIDTLYDEIHGQHWIGVKPDEPPASADDKTDDDMEKVSSIMEYIKKKAHEK